MAEQSRGRAIAMWVLAGLLALAFLGAGGTKLADTGASTQQFEDWGYPGAFAYVIATVEVVAGLLVLWPRAAPYAAAVLVGDMLGAMVTHIANAEALMVPVNLVLGGLAGALAWLRRPAWFDERFGKKAAST